MAKIKNTRKVGIVVIIVGVALFVLESYIDIYVYDPREFSLLARYLLKIPFGIVTVTMGMVFLMSSYFEKK